MIEKEGLLTGSMRHAEYVANQKEEASRLKEELNAVIIVHNYQRDEIQDMGDFVGDSLELSRIAARTEAEVIVFCGVHFMAESAAILSPSKKVLLPVIEAACPMADMITAKKLRSLKEKYPKAAVVCYVNSSAAVKAESDICCTSSNAVAVVNSLKDHEQILFVPDKNLANYVAKFTDKEIITYDAFCPTHIRLQEEDVIEAKEANPDAEFVAHPECLEEVLKLADHICSTSGMLKYCKASPKREFIIGTEMGLLYRLKKENPDKKFILPTEHLVCANMKLTTLGWMIEAMQSLTHEIKVNPEIRDKARKALDRMLAVQ